MSYPTLPPSALSLSAIILDILMVILLSFVVVAKTSNLDWLQFAHWNPVKFVHFTTFYLTIYQKISHGLHCSSGHLSSNACLFPLEMQSLSRRRTGFAIAMCNSDKCLGFSLGL